MRDLFIVGAGGFGREAVWTVERINKASQQPLWNVIGFADDDPQKAEGNFEGYPMLGSVEKASRDKPGASVFIAIGDNAIRRKIYKVQQIYLVLSIATLSCECICHIEDLS